MSGFHVGRSWVGTRLEDDCPCPKAACGLAAPTADSPACEQHNPMSFWGAKTLRQMHSAKDCPAL